MAKLPKKRIELFSSDIDSAAEDIIEKLYDRLDQKGYVSYIGPHEGLGIITEEYYELVDAVKSNDSDNYEEELIDIAVGCIVALASNRKKDRD